MNPRASDDDDDEVCDERWMEGSDKESYVTVGALLANLDSLSSPSVPPRPSRLRSGNTHRGKSTDKEGSWRRIGRGTALETDSKEKGVTIVDLIRPRGIFRDTGTESGEKERGWTSQEERRNYYRVEGGRDEERRERERGGSLGRRHETHGDRSLHK